MYSYVPPIKIVADEVVREEQIVINKQEFPHAGTSEHDRDLAAEGTTPYDRHLSAS